MASTTLMELLVKLGLDTSEFSRGLDAAENKAKGFGGKVTSGLSAVGFGVLTAGAAAATAAIGATSAVLISSVDDASNLAESMNAVNVTFGTATETILEYGKTAATQVGLSNAAFNSMAVVTGSFLQNLGFDAEGAAQETINLTERAADMASVFNTDVSEAMGAIQSGLKGEFNPLERFGVKLNAATIEAKAMAMGLAETKGELTDSMKAAAALELIYEQTAKTQGDFQNTSSGLANSQRILKSTWQDMKAALGSALLPALEKLAGKLKDLLANKNVQDMMMKIAQSFGDFAMKVVEWLPKAFAKISEVFNYLQNNKAVVIGILAALSVAVIAFAVSAIAAMIPMLPVIGAVIGIMAAVGAIVFLVKSAWDSNFLGIQDRVAEFRNGISGVFDWIKNLFTVVIPGALTTLRTKWSGVTDFITNAWASFTTAISNLWNNVLLPAFQAVWGFLQNSIFPLFRAVADFVNAIFNLAFRVLAGIWQNVVLPALTAVWSFIDRSIKPVFEWVANFIKTVFNIQMQAVATIINNVVKPAFEWVADFINNKVKPAFNAIAGAIQNVVSWIQKMIDKINNITLPDWLTPGSPTPFELGLKGISSAIRHLARTDLPTLRANLELIPTRAMLEAGTNDKPQTINYYNLTMPTAMNPYDVYKGYEMTRVIYGNA